MTVAPIRFISGKKDAIDAVQEVYGKFVSAASCVVSIFSSEAANLAAKTLIPFRAISIVASTIFLGITIKDGIQEAHKAERKYKVIPSFKVVNAIGELFDNASTFLSFFGKIAPLALNHVATALGITALPLQVFGIAEKSMKIHSLRKQGRTFRALKLDQPAQALQSIRSKEGSLSFFRMVDHTQSAAIKAILNSESITAKANAVDLIDRKITHNKKVNALQLALTILSIVGIVLLLTVTAAAPILWGVLGVGTLAGISLGLYSYFSNRKFTSDLKEQQRLSAPPQ